MANLSLRSALDVYQFAALLAVGEGDLATPTKLRIRTDADDYVDFIGTGLTYDSSGIPTGGTVKSVTSVVDGAVQFTLNQFSVPVTSIIAAIQTMDPDAVLGLFLGANDRITGKDGDDVLYGFGGTDSITGGLGQDSLFGGEGNDKLYTSDDNFDYATGGIGNDTYYIDSNDTVVELDGEGTDTIYVSTYYHLSDVQNSIENLYALGGDANLAGNGLRNNIKGNSGDDTLSGLGDRDTIFGGSGADTILGGDEYDRLFGDGGADTILGDDGTDRIDGGTGNDQLYGGGDDDDKDTFIFQVGTTSFGRDTINDFEDGTDRIEIRGFANYAAAVAGGMTISEDAGGNALIKFANPIATITLAGIDQAQVTTADFVFVV